MHVKRILSVTTLLLSLCLGGGGGRAQAQDDDPEVVRMAKEHYKLGQDAYKAGKYDLAIKELKKAYLLKRIPAILINIGLTYRKMKDYDMSIYFFRKFLAEAPAEDKQRPQAEAELGEVEAEKAAALAQPRQGSKPAVEAAPKAKGQPAAAVPAAGANPSATGTQALQAPTAEWAHTPIDAVPPEMPVDVRVQMPVMKGVKVKVFFRKEGQATFDSLELKRRGNEKIARLPAEVASGRTFQYYIEARDGAGTLVKSSGSEASPNIVLIDKSAKQQVAGQEAAEGPDDEELAKKGKSFSRDIENEAVTFDPKALEQKRMMERLHQQVRDEGPKKKPVFSTIGWARRRGARRRCAAPGRRLGAPGRRQVLRDVDHAGLELRPGLAGEGQRRAPVPALQRQPRSHALRLLALAQHGGVQQQRADLQHRGHRAGGGRRGWQWPPAAC